MGLLIVSSIWAATIGLLLYRAVRQYGFYEVIGPEPSAIDPSASVAVIIPARNEAGNIRQCLERLCQQAFPVDRLTITVVDDNSTDRTAEIVSEIAGKDPRVQLISAGPLPEGWKGKPHACWVGSRSAGNVDWLCFCDADTAAEPLLLNTAVAAARNRSVAFLSLEPFQELVLPWERLVLPCGFFLVAFTQDVRRANDPNDPEAHANGQFLLVDRRAYEAMGTFEAVRDRIAEDSALARRAKEKRLGVAVLGTRDLIHTRMYRDFRSMALGLSRQAGELLGGPGKLVAFAAMAMAITLASVAVPLWAIVAARSGDGFAVVSLALSFAASLSLLGTHIGAARYFKISILYGFLYPLGYTLGAGILLHAAIARLRGRVVWKDRAYVPNQRENSRV